VFTNRHQLFVIPMGEKHSCLSHHFLPSFFLPLPFPCLLLCLETASSTLLRHLGKHCYLTHQCWILNRNTFAVCVFRPNLCYLLMTTVSTMLLRSWNLWVDIIVQLSNTTQHRVVPIICSHNLQTIIIAQMLSIAGEGCQHWEAAEVDNNVHIQHANYTRSIIYYQY